MTTFVRLLEQDDKRAALRETSGGLTELVYEVESSVIRRIPTSPFCYWLGESVWQAFAILPPFASEDEDRGAVVGLQTSDDFRFLRTWTEVRSPELTGGWSPIAKGGKRSPYYRDISSVVNWRREGLEIRNFVDPGTGRLRSRPQNLRYYGRGGLSWPLRGIRFSCEPVPRASLFSVAGKLAYLLDEHLLPYLAIANSGAFDALMKTFAGKVGGVQYEAGLIERTPVPRLDDPALERLSALALRCWSSRRAMDQGTETSHAFLLPAVVGVIGDSLAVRSEVWARRTLSLDNDFRDAHVLVETLCFELYNITKRDEEAIVAGVALSTSHDPHDDHASADEEADDLEGEEAVDPEVLAAGLVSWCVGVGVSRFDVRLATGGREWPVEPDPFDPLPVCSPGMLIGDDGLPLESPPAGYPVEVSPVLVTDPGHRLDITARVRSVFDVVFGTDADAWWGDVGEALGAKGGEVEGWLAKGFFDHHLGIHTASGRKAPILWPLGTKSGSYLVWLYAHRVTADSLFQILHDIVSPKITLEEQRLTQARQTAGPSPTASQRRDIDKQAAFVDELREFAEAIAALAPLWAPDLNDGIVIVLAPLWSLFAHHKPWAKELKAHWVKLVAGDYDWAQLAMHLWPERVIPKCATDRSLAIAHNLEEVFWVQDTTNADKWHRRQTPTTPTDQLITQHHNPATTAALKATNT